MSFEPSKYQAKVYDFITDDEGNAVINAVAGSGKTTTLIEALKKIPSSASVQFLAFNKSIKGEIQQRVNDIGVTNTTVNTCHGFGFLTILNSLEHAPEIDNLKYRKLLRAIFDYVSTEDSKHIDPYKIKGDDMGLVWSFDVDWEEVDNKLEFSRRILQLANLGRMNLTTDVQNLESIAEKYNISLFNDEAKLASNLVKLADKFLDTIDFTDMIYLPNKMNMSCQKFDWVFIDECQDLNAAQRELMLKSMHPNSRFIAVGDKHQCQPRGTKILMSNGIEKNIEDLEVGDKVVSYEPRKKSGFYGFLPTSNLYERYNKSCAEVLEVEHHWAITDMYTIKGGKYLSRYTFNHKCMAKFNLENSNGAFIVYLMQKNGNFRVGIYPLFHKEGNTNSFGLSARCRTENADKGWILDIYETREEAYENEQIISYKFGIPQLRFLDNTKANNQDSIDFIWESINQNNDLYLKAVKLLKSKNKDINLPFWVNGEKKYYSRNSFRPYHACNLFAKYMDIGIFDETTFIPNKPKKIIPIKIDSIDIEKDAYIETFSLKVSREELYVADKILTHNSIYGFAGADADSFDKLVNLPNTKTLPLSTCYRCGSDIIKQAQNIVPQIEAFEKNGKGYVNFDGKIADIKDGDMVLCRNTYPLVKMCLGFLKAGIKATIMGGDIGKSLINMVKDTNQKEMDKVFDGLYHTLDTTLKRIMRADNCTAEDAREHIEYVNAEEKIQVIEAIYEAGDTAETVIKKLEGIFNDVTKDGIILSTIHKSKGLEAERVFIIHPERMPSKFATQEWELVQEDNLRYVAYTRAKNLLSFVRDFDAYKGRELESFADKVKEVKESNHVGEVGCRYALKGTITECRYIPNYDAMVYVIEDKEGNIYEKWGDINRKYITSETKELKEGVEIKASVMISKHTEFRGVKKNTIKNLGVYR